MTIKILRGMGTNTFFLGMLIFFVIIGIFVLWLLSQGGNPTIGTLVRPR